MFSDTVKEIAFYLNDSIAGTLLITLIVFILGASFYREQKKIDNENTDLQEIRRKAFKIFLELDDFKFFYTNLIKNKDNIFLKEEFSEGNKTFLGSKHTPENEILGFFVENDEFDKHFEKIISMFKKMDLSMGINKIPYIKKRVQNIRNNSWISILEILHRNFAVKEEYFNKVVSDLENILEEIINK